MATQIQIQLETLPDGLTIAKQRAEYGKLVRQSIADEKRAAITAGSYLALCKATFTLDETDAWKLWATSVTGKSYKTVESYLSVAKAYGTSTKTLQAKVATWPFESLQAYASVAEEDRAAVVAGVGDSSPSPEKVRETRDAVKLGKLTPAERKEKETARKTREKETAASKTDDARKAVGAFIGKKGPESKTPEQLLQIGAMVQKAHGDYAEPGIASYFVQLAKIREELAKAKTS